MNLYGLVVVGVVAFRLIPQGIGRHQQVVVTGRDDRHRNRAGKGVLSARTRQRRLVGNGEVPVRYFAAGMVVGGEDHAIAPVGEGGAGADVADDPADIQRLPDDDVGCCRRNGIDLQVHALNRQVEGVNVVGLVALGLGVSAVGHHQQIPRPGHMLGNGHGRGGGVRGVAGQRLVRRRIELPGIRIIRVPDLIIGDVEPVKPARGTGIAVAQVLHRPGHLDALAHGGHGGSDTGSRYRQVRRHKPDGHRQQVVVLIAFGLVAVPVRPDQQVVVARGPGRQGYVALDGVVRSGGHRAVSLDVLAVGIQPGFKRLVGRQHEPLVPNRSRRPVALIDADELNMNLRTAGGLGRDVRRDDRQVGCL